MNAREHLFQIWAPSQSPWSVWAKPVLFAHLVQLDPEQDESWMQAPADWAPPADGHTTIILDLPAADSVATALSLARRGYRPVPLFNAVPGPLTANVQVNLWLAMRRIIAASPLLESLNLPAQAPPAFLLDADRRTGQKKHVFPGDFDNRSISFPTDFPSAGFLLAHEIRQAILVPNQPQPPQPDLAHTLRAWQNGNINLQTVSTISAPAPHPLTIPKPSRFGWLWYPLLESLKLKRSPLGGFGGILPLPSTG